MRRSARDVARRVLARVQSGSYASLALDGELRRSGLEEADRALATELVYGVLRQRLRLDRALAAYASRGLPKDETTLDALRLAAYQMLATRVPSFAAVDDAVRAIKRVRGERQAGFVNALLRRLAQAGEPSLQPSGSRIRDLEAATSTPAWIVGRVVDRLGNEQAAAALEGMNAPAPVWLRINTARANREQLVDELRRERPQIVLAPSPLAPDALAAAHGGDLFSTRAYAEGRFIAQDLGAQLVVRLVDPQPGERILDACAGVGGKTTYLAALADGRAEIDAADRSSRKLELAADHAHRLGLAGIRFIVADLTDAAAPLASAYDRVLLDAPCSGLGVLRRHPELKWRIAAEQIAGLAALQARLLDVLAPRLRVGGLLVYAVCTFTEEEGPAQVARFIERHPQFVLEPLAPPAPLAAAQLVSGERGGELHTWPHLHGSDAFFAARLRRRS